MIADGEQWGRKSEENERSTPESGQRLIVRRDALSQYLTSMEMDMVFVVKIERQFRRDSFRWKKTPITDYVPPYTLTLILKADGTIKTI